MTVQPSECNVTSSPTVVNLDRPQYGRELQAIHIEDPAVVGAALVAFGVPEDQVPEWKVYSAYPGRDAKMYGNPFATYVETKDVRREMWKGIGIRGDLKAKMEANFEVAATEVVLRTLAQGAINNAEDRPFPLRHPIALKLVGWLGVVSCTKLAIDHAIAPDSNMPELMESIFAATAGFFAASIISKLISIESYAKKAVKKLRLNRPDIIEGFEASLSPVYSE